MHHTAASLLGGLFGATGRLMHSRPAPNNAVSHKCIHLAARYGHVAALEALLEAGCDVDLSDEVRETFSDYSYDEEQNQLIPLRSCSLDKLLCIMLRLMDIKDVFLYLLVLVPMSLHWIEVSFPFSNITFSNVFHFDLLFILIILNNKLLLSIVEARRPEQIAAAAGHMEAAAFLRRLSETTQSTMANMHTGRVGVPQEKAVQGPGPVRLLISEEAQPGSRISRSGIDFPDQSYDYNVMDRNQMSSAFARLDTLRQGATPEPSETTLRTLKSTLSSLSEADLQSIPLTPPPLEPSRARLRDWLMSIGLSEYYPAMLRHGYDDIDFIASTGGLTNSDCAAIGVYAVGHRRKLCTNFGIKPFTAQGIHETWYASQLEKLALKKQAEKLAQLESLLSKEIEKSKKSDTDEEYEEESEEESDDENEEESDEEDEDETDDEEGGSEEESEDDETDDEE